MLLLFACDDCARVACSNLAAFCGDGCSGDDFCFFAGNACAWLGIFAGELAAESEIPNNILPILNLRYHPGQGMRARHRPPLPKSFRPCSLYLQLPERHLALGRVHRQPSAIPKHARILLCPPEGWYASGSFRITQTAGSPSTWHSHHPQSRGCTPSGTRSPRHPTVPPAGSGTEHKW